jgi:hypothetical protein
LRLIAHVRAKGGGNVQTSFNSCMNFSNKRWRARGTGQIAGHVASRLRTTNVLLLREDLVELLRRFRAAADINLGLEVKVSTELHQQIFAALDGDDGAAGLDANIGLARMEFFQAARGKLMGSGFYF